MIIEINKQGFDYLQDTISKSIFGHLATISNLVGHVTLDDFFKINNDSTRLKNVMTEIGEIESLYENFRMCLDSDVVEWVISSSNPRNHWENRKDGFNGYLLYIFSIMRDKKLVDLV
jgi:hypothetical protein